jgi:RNA polymerase sigma-70 factor (ECF subfamily)
VRLRVARSGGDSEAERQAIAELIAGWQGQVERWLSFRGVSDPEHREEILARWACRLVKALKDNDGFDQPFGAVAMKNADWAHGDHFRYAIRENEIVMEDPTVAQDEVEPVDEDVSIDPSALEDALSSLSERDREILSAVITDDLSSAEAAERLDMTPGALRTAQSRALAKLRERLAELGVTERGQSPVSRT